MEFLTQLINYVDEMPAWVNAITGVISAATAITILTPTKTDDSIVSALLKVLNFLAGNFGKNKNEDA